MVKYFLLSLLILSFSFPAFTQDPTDALRYSFLTGDGGTARNQSLGGAGGSLGGEFSSIFMNPAGLGFFKTGDFVITPSLRANSNDATYLGSQTTADSRKVSLGTLGVLFATEYRNRKIKNVTLGIGVNKAANFNNTIYYQGKNTSSSYSEKFKEEFERDGVVDDQAAGYDYPYGSSLAFNTYLINPVFNSNGEVEGYSTLANPAFGLRQTMDRQTSGGITDLAVGVGANYQDKFYFGGTVSLPFLKYKRTANYSEADMSGDLHNDFGSFDANEILETKGTGINLKLGVIYKPVPNFQAGLSFTTPTFFQLTDLYNMTITTDPEGYEGQGIQTQSSTDLNQGYYLKSTYNLITPLRAMLSGTYFFSTGEIIEQQKGFITADIEFVNYKNSNFRDANNSEDYKSYYSILNGVIDKTYSPAVNFRIGGEWKLNLLMLRLGGAYYGNPYDSENSSLTKITGGIGYRNRGIYVDLAYTYGIHKDTEYPYRLDNAIVPSALLTNRGNNIALTVGFKLY